MSYWKQVTPFNPAKMGKTKNFCLRNTRQGFGIGSKYANAKDAMNGKGNLSISTRLEYLTEAYQFGEDVIKPGDFVVIGVTDTGCGIPSENINRIFEPFFSTKKNVVGSGTGLGLAMVYGIVRQTEGFIKVHSEVGKGTTFEIYLPAYENDIEEKGCVEQKFPEEITKKEIEVMEQVALGLNNKEIAANLFLSEGTVRNYISTILEKLDLRDRTQLAIYYLKG